MHRIIAPQVLLFVAAVVLTRCDPRSVPRHGPAIRRPGTERNEGSRTNDQLEAWSGRVNGDVQRTVATPSDEVEAGIAGWTWLFHCTHTPEGGSHALRRSIAVRCTGDRM